MKKKGTKTLKESSWKKKMGKSFRLLQPDRSTSYIFGGLYRRASAPICANKSRFRIEQSPFAGGRFVFFYVRISDAYKYLICITSVCVCMSGQQATNVDNKHPTDGNRVHTRSGPVLPAIHIRDAYFFIFGLSRRFSRNCV